MFVPTEVDQSIAILKRLLATLTLRLLVDCSRNRSLSIVGRPDSPMLLSIQELCESRGGRGSDANQPNCTLVSRNDSLCLIGLYRSKLNFTVIAGGEDGVVDTVPRGLIVHQEFPVKKGVSGELIRVNFSTQCNIVTF